MTAIMNDPTHGVIIRVTCPNCGSRHPIIKDTIDGINVLFGACGLNEERTSDGAITVIVPCRVRKRG